MLAALVTCFNLNLIRSFWLAFMTISAVVFSSACMAGQAYKIIDLGALDGGFARARAINDSGQVVIGESLLPIQAIVERATVWESGNAVDLGTLGGARSRAVFLNNGGVVCGWAESDSGIALPTLWTKKSVTVLPTVNGLSGTVWAINSSGIAVGSAYFDRTTFHAAVWDKDGCHDLGTLGGRYSLAYAINSRGMVAGHSYDAEGRQRACVWDANSTEPVDLGAVPGGQWTVVRGINDSGQVIFWGTPAGAASKRAVFWDGNWGHAPVALGTFGGRESWAYALNNQGVVVGTADLPDFTYHAFVWDGSTMIDLGTLGGYYSAAWGINSHGDVVGFAHDEGGVTHAVAWVSGPRGLGSPSK